MNFSWTITALSKHLITLLGINFGRWEVLGGYQYSSFENKKFTTTKNLSISGGLMVFGVGVGVSVSADV